jgi:hypothetical protein
MSDGWRSRRSVLLATAGAGVLAAAALGYEAVRLIGRRPPSPYDDLLSLLPDRDAAAQVGLAYLNEHPRFDSATAAHLLRKEIGSRPLASVLQEDIAEARLVEAGHWLMPDTLVLLSALAANPNSSLAPAKRGRGLG